ncbi:MAG: cupin domain-containing protein, partial [Hyphomicrobiales bacterium]|nr:cupin domain-containing protein [Hyphomicrobiales bacterium]
MRKISLALSFLLVAVAPVMAQDMSPPVNAKDLKWAPVPNILPPGATFAVVSGDPYKDELYVLRLKMPAGYKIPAHNHPTSEYVTVLSGNFHLGLGDKLDPKKGMVLTAGGFAAAPA